jgi:hypothetical protein
MKKKKRILGCLRVPPVEYHCDKVISYSVIFTVPWDGTIPRTTIPAERQKRFILSDVKSEMDRSIRSDL